MLKYKTNGYGYYETYTFEEFIAEGCPEDIPIGLFKLDTKIYRDTFEV